MVGEGREKEELVFWKIYLQLAKRRGPVFEKNKEETLGAYCLSLEWLVILTQTETVPTRNAEALK